MVINNGTAAQHGEGKTRKTGTGQDSAELTRLDSTRLDREHGTCSNADLSGLKIQYNMIAGCVAAHRVAGCCCFWAKGQPTTATTTTWTTNNNNRGSSRQWTTLLLLLLHVAHPTRREHNVWIQYWRLCWLPFSLPLSPPLCARKCLCLAS